MVDSRKYICSGKQRTMNWVKSVEYYGRISVTNKSQLRCYWIEEESLLEWRFSFHIQSSNRNIVLIFLSLSLFLSFLVSVPAPSFSIFLFIFFLLPFLSIVSPKSTVRVLFALIPSLCDLSVWLSLTKLLRVLNSTIRNLDWLCKRRFLLSVQLPCEQEAKYKHSCQWGNGWTFSKKESE